jgi:hypothetical protein
MENPQFFDKLKQFVFSDVKPSTGLLAKDKR